jgi:colanic acid/amylovoran biosynthesis glycosyltransferase
LKRLLILEGCPKTKIVKVPLGVDVNKWLPMNWADRLKGAPSIVFLGRFAAKKNPVALLEAFAIALAQVPNAKLTMIGDGEEMSRVKARVSSLGIEGSVDILGAMPQEQALEAVRRHWIYAQHSVTPTSGDQETFGLSLAEAQAMELGVVSTYHNGIPENVIEGETGLLCREYDYETMGAHMVSLLKDKEELRRMGVAGRKHVLNSFQPEVRKKAIISILERLK